MHRAANRRSAAAYLSRVAYDVSDRILAAVMAGPQRPIDLREFDRPALPAGAALLRTERSEVCGTDVHLWHGRLSGVPYPIIPGHVSAGTVDAARGPRPRPDRGPRRASAHPARASRGRPGSGRRAGRVFRRAPAVWALPRVHRAPHAHALR